MKEPSYINTFRELVYEDRSFRLRTKRRRAANKLARKARRVARKH